MLRTYNLNTPRIDVSLLHLVSWKVGRYKMVSLLVGACVCVVC